MDDAGDLIERVGTRAILEEHLKREARWKPTVELFAQQRDFVVDPSRFKAALCSRRAGKTKACAHYLYRVALGRPGAICLYIALTRISAKRIVWRELIRLDRVHALGAKFNLTELTVELPNGSQIFLTGTQHEDDIEKWRGNPYDLVVVDEAGSFGEHIDQLMDDVIVPALMDHKGTMALIGTPNAKCAGRFYEITEGKKRGHWSTHKWTTFENPFIPDVQAELAIVKDMHGWTDQTPAFLREYRGLWVRSNDRLVYRYDSAKNDWDEMAGLAPGHDWQYVIGSDVGVRDRTAFVVLAWAESSPAAYFIHSEAKSGMIPATVAERFQQLLIAYPRAQLVMDCGALGLGYAEEFRQRYGLPIHAADKRDKFGGIELLNGDLAKQRLFCPAGSPLAEEWCRLQFDDKGKEDPRAKNDLSDAGLYAYRFSRHYWHQDHTPAPTPNSEAAMLETFQRAKAAAERDPWSDFGPGGDDFGPGAF